MSNSDVIVSRRMPMPPAVHLLHVDSLHRRSWRSVGTVCCSALVLMHSLACAKEMPDDVLERPDALTRQALQLRIAEQTEQINVLKRAIAEQESSLAQLRHAVNGNSLQIARGRGTSDTSNTPGPSSLARAEGAAPASASPVSPVMQTAQIFDQPGVLTQPGKYVLEPSLQYSYSSANRVALIGYTVIPALLIGLIDVREVKRNTMTAALSGRFGVTNRLELEARIPYVYRTDTTVSREIATGTAADRVFEASGRQLGDIELAARYQLNDGSSGKGFYIGSLRYKARNGRDPFEVVTDCVQRCVGNASGTGLPLQLPTGSGFTSLQGGVTWLFPTDPAVLFGSVTYLHNFERSNVSRTVLNGEREFLGSVAPGGVLGFNIGMGLALNDKTSFSIGYDHNSIGRTKQAGQVVPGSVRTQLGTLLLGFSHRIDDNKTLMVSIGAGLTRDTPDLTLNLKIPISN